MAGSPDEPLQAAPVRQALDDLAAPVDLALIEQNEQVAQGLVQNAVEGRAMATRGLEVSEAPVARGALSRAPARLAAKNKWPKGELRVYFYGGPVALQKRVREIADEWSKYANIDFKPASGRADADIRVAFQGTGHWSYVGTDCQNVQGQTMNLELRDPPSNGEYNYGVVLHEFGHAIGCIHEHQQPGAEGLFDERAVINYFQSQYGWDATKTRLNVLNRYDRTQLLRFTKFDIRCIMLYSYPPEITKNKKGTPQNIDLSAWDKYFISKLYPGRATLAEPTDNGGETPPKPTTTEPSASAKTLPSDGTPVDGRIAPSASVNKYTFETTESGSYDVWTKGYTQVKFKLAKADGTVIELKPTTRDLVNPMATTPDLPTGKYTLEVSHKHAGGTGEYSIYLRKK